MFNYFAPPQEPKKIDKDKFQFHQHKKVKDLTKKWVKYVELYTLAIFC